MAINLNAFNQNAPQIDLANSFRQGVAAVNDVYGAKRQKQALIADQFANQQAPILAQQKADLNAQTILASQQEQAQKEKEAKQKYYTDSMSIIGRSLYGVNDPNQVPAVIGSLKQMADAGIINPDVFTSLPGIKEGRLPTVEEAKMYSQQFIEVKDQLINQREIEKAKQAEEKAVRLEEIQRDREQGLQSRFEAGQQGAEERLNKTLASQENRAIASQERQIEKEEKQAKKYDLSTAFTIRKEYQPKVAAFEEVKKNYEQLKGLGSQNNPKAQMAMIYSFMKILDPESTVRESEYASVTQASSVLNKMGIYTEKLESGKLLSKKDVQEILSAVAPVYVYAQKKQQAEQANYSSLMKENGIDPKTVQLKFYNFGKQPEVKTNFIPQKTSNGLSYEIMGAKPNAN